MSKNWQRLLLALRVATSAGLLYYVVRLIDWRLAWDSCASSRVVFLVAGMLCVFLAMSVGAFRWKVVLAGTGVALRYGLAYMGYWVGNFFNVFLPGVLGGDVIRVRWAVTHAGAHWAASAATVFVERLCGFAAVIVLLLTGLSLQPDLTLFTGDASATQVRLLGGLGLMVLLAALVLRGTWVRVLRKAVSTVSRPWMETGLETFAQLAGRSLWGILLLSILFQGMDILMVYLVSEALDLGVHFMVFLAYLPMVYVLTTLPVSLGGLGVREGALVFLLSQVGVPSGEAAVLAFLIYVIRAIVGSLGWTWNEVRRWTRAPRRVPCETDAQVKS